MQSVFSPAPRPRSAAVFPEGTRSLDERDFHAPDRLFWLCGATSGARSCCLAQTPAPWDARSESLPPAPPFVRRIAIVEQLREPPDRRSRNLRGSKVLQAASF